MKINFNHLCAVVALTSMTFTVLTSCDSGERIDPNDPALSPNAVSESLEILLNNDRLSYTSVSSANAVTSFVTFVSDNVATTFGSVNYTYNKSGRFLFELEADYVADTNLNAALQTSLASISPNGTRLRQLLLRSNPVFTPAELTEIIGILNPLGAELSIDPNNNSQILAVAQRLYTHEVTSSNQDLAAGVQSGNYKVDDISFVVSFRNPTSTDLSDFRLITNQTKIPEVSDTIANTFVKETGRWILSLANN